MSAAAANSLATMGLNTIGTGGSSGVSANGYSFGDPNSLMGTIGGVVSLADMINNWGLAKKATELNMKNLRQQMAQSGEAFERSVARQDRSLANVQDSSARSLAQYGG